MTATVKKVKTLPKTAPKKVRQAPVVVQTKKAVRTKKVTQVKQVAAAGKAAAVEPVTDVLDVMPMATVVEEITVTPKANSTDNVDRILLPARMELSSLDEAHQLLQSRYPPVHAKYILDGALMSVIDMAGIQMLISFIRSVGAKGSKVEWDNYSVQVYQLASELGVTSQLGD